MTRKRLWNIIILIVVIYILCIVIGILLRIFDNTEDQVIYDTFTDMIPLIFAVPLGYLGFCFQRRNNFVKSLKDLWQNMIFALNETIKYTYKEETTSEEYEYTLIELSKVIDELRGVYKNIGETKTSNGLYPFEPIKSIRKEIEELGYGKMEYEKSKIVRKIIIGNWKLIRTKFLHEFDRYEPTKPVSKYILK